MAAEPKNKSSNDNSQAQQEPPAAPPAPPGPAAAPSAPAAASSAPVAVYVVAEGQCVSGLQGSEVEGETRTAHAGQALTADDLDPAAYPSAAARTARLERLVVLGALVKAGSVPAGAVPAGAVPVVATAVTSQEEVQ